MIINNNLFNKRILKKKMNKNNILNRNNYNYKAT